MKRQRLSRFVDRRGVAAVEFAVVLPMLCFLLFGIWELGRLINVQIVLNNAARETGRQASTGAKTVAQIKQTAVDYLAEQGITITSADVTVTNVTNGSNTDPRTATQLDQFALRITVPIANVRWVTAGFYRFSGNLVAGSNWCSMKDTPLEVSSDIPLE